MCEETREMVSSWIDRYLFIIKAKMVVSAENVMM